MKWHAEVHGQACIIIIRTRITAKLAKKPRKCLSLLLVLFDNEALTSKSATTKTNNFVWMISMQYKRSARAQPGEQTQNTQTNKQADRQN